MARSLVGRSSLDLLASFLLMFLTESGHVNGYSNGAPDDVCQSMMPSHQSDAQTAAAPYKISISMTTYEAKKSLTVTISGSLNFEGFLLEARRTPSNDPLGTFSNFSSGVKPACLGTAITHSTKASKYNVTARWTAPVTSGHGDVIFVATVVKSFSTFWTNIRSSVLTEVASDSGDQQSVSGLADQQQFQEVNTSLCDKSVACFRVPDGCDICDLVLTWADAGPAVSFELAASVKSSNYWVGFALSKDTKMGSDSVVECVYNGQGIDVQVSWNAGTSNNILSDHQFGLVPNSTSASMSNGRIVCRFQRLKTAPSTSSRKRRQTNADMFYPLDNTANYYIMLAKGPTYGGIKQQHDSTEVSSEPVNITAYVTVRAADATRNLVKAHGILMMVAWMVLASFGMLMPRYCKLAWPDSTWCGKKIWFQIHQAAMASSLILTAVGFIIIFVAAGDYSELPSPTVAHPPLGIIATALVIINPIMALFRPDPNTKRRPLFNVLHFLVGLLAHLSAGVTLFLGMYMKQLNLPTWCMIIMAVYICFHALTEVTLALHKHARKFVKNETKEYQMQPSNQSAQMQPINQSAPPPTNQDSGSGFITTVLSIHLIGVLAFCIAISVQVGKS